MGFDASPNPSAPDLQGSAPEPERREATPAFQTGLGSQQTLIDELGESRRQNLYLTEENHALRQMLRLPENARVSDGGNLNSELLCVFEACLDKDGAS
mmetsp:Transcript_47817/g.74636  ORF Transcript_47817/g.74636 Transcript_47817/m.74636 type:complete len:98 (-) Transcript_47817:1565-1858(-)